MKKLLFIFALTLAIVANGQTTLTQQVGTHALSYNGNTVYKEARCISFSWNGDSLDSRQNAINVLVRVRYYYKNSTTKIYLDSLSDSGIPVNPWVSRMIILKASPGIMIDSSTTEIVQPDSSGNYPAGSVDEFLYWNQLFPEVFNAINSQVILENSLGRL